MTDEQRRLKAKQLRYKKPIVRDLNLETIRNELWEMAETSAEMEYLDEYTILSAFSDDWEDVEELKIMFSDLATDANRMMDDLEDECIPKYFDAFFVAIGAGRYGGGLMGYDSYEDDYFGLEYISYIDDMYAEKLKRLTKDELILTISICSKVMYSYVGLKYRYDCLKASYDVLKGEAVGYMEIIKGIENAYNALFDDSRQGTYEPMFDRLIAELPPEVWVI